MRVVFLVQKIGPYHQARLLSYTALQLGELHVIEFRPQDSVYAWAPVTQTGGYARSQTRTIDELLRALNEINPHVVVCVGYADREISGAVNWALGKRIPLVTCSDSTYDDELRSSLKEMFKRQVVNSFDAALVAGHRARAYLAGLGMEKARIFSPWDVVDNDYFWKGTERFRSNEAGARAQFNLPDKYFLCVARFVTKKNLVRFVAAYGDYVRQTKGEPWSLVLSGAGPLDSELRELVHREKIGAFVRFPGFLQYDQLPAYYALGGALVLPSVSDQWGLVVNEAMAAGLPVLVSDRCGCAPDLVQEGQNGFVFDAQRGEAITQSLLKMTAANKRERDAMGQRSREIIAEYSPEKFARGLVAAIECAVSRPRNPARWLPRIVAQSLALRPTHS